MDMKNVSGKSLSRKLPDKEWITLKDGESHNFPDTQGFLGDERLEIVKAVKAVKVEEPKKVKKSFLDLNNDGIVDSKDFSKAAKVLASKLRRKSKK